MKEGSRNWGLGLEIRSVVGEERVKRNEEAEVGGIEGKAERREDMFHLLLVLVVVVVAITATFAIFASRRGTPTRVSQFSILQDKRKVDRDRIE